LVVVFATVIAEVVHWTSPTLVNIGWLFAIFILNYIKFIFMLNS